MLDLKNYTSFHSPGYVIEIYCNGKEKEIVYGNREIIPKIKPCNKKTLYDIASLTKIFTATLVYIAYEEKKLKLNNTVYELDNHFQNLKEVTILDLLSHNQEIWTNGYLGSAKTQEEFYQTLYSSSVKSNFPTYVDTHYIILSTLLEKVYGKSYVSLLQEKIFVPLHLENTTVNPECDNIASNNYETVNGKKVDTIFPGVIHDTKGRVAKNLGITTGHASIFTTGADLLQFLKSFLDCRLLKKETIAFMIKHTDKNQENLEILKQIVLEEDINRMYEKAKKVNPDVKVMRTYNFMGTRYKNFIYELNDVPTVCSEDTIAFSGFTGPSFIIDFAKKIIVVVMCNVMHNTHLSRIERKKNTDTIIENICKKIY